MVNLDRIRLDVENFSSEMNLEYFLTHAGFKEESNISAIYEKYAHLFDKKLIVTLAGMRKQARDEDERKLRYLQAFSLEYYLGMVVKELTDKAETMQTKGTVKVDGEKLAFHLAQIRMINEPNRQKREKLYQARNKCIDKINGPLLERMQKLHGAARDFGYKDYMALFMDAKEIDFPSLAKTMQDFISQTESIYTQRMNEELREKVGVGIKEAEKHDVSFFFRAKEFDTYFKKQSMIPALKKTLANMGIKLAKQKNVTLDLEERPKKNPRAFCTPIKIPEDVRLVMMPHGGHDDYATLLHETGHVEHFAYVNPKLPIEYKWLGDNSVTESFAFLLEYLLTDENWLEQHIKIDKTEQYLNFVFLYKLFFLRAYGAKISYEIKLHTDHLDGMDEIYKTVHEKVLKYKHPTTHYLITVDDAFYSAQYLQAWIFEAQLKNFLVREYGEEWFNNVKAGNYLTNLWSYGQKYNVVELAKILGYSGLDVKPLTTSIMKHLR
ncbi:MAG: hypothetical protein ACQXXH_05205 [Candidatus Bathyarchaeia archaeon]|jgi:oligoendopeptidase F|nr:hypothetical protein [Candidatus Bathyarchaeota archaeon A05DMB-4]MDH7595681.1 hypothetical protein [Candidatus Bathyarchaeota archaeon]